MESLFFNLHGSFDDVAGTVFAVLGLPRAQGDSANVLGGYYYVASALGVDIRLERNSYDYEEEYEYMLSVRGNRVSAQKVAPAVAEWVGRAVARMLADNAGVTLARETNDGLEVMHP